jgi:hypothetical protein
MYHKMVQWLCQSKLIKPPRLESGRKNIMENQTVTIEQVIALSDNLAALPKDANQGQLAEAIADASLIQIAAVSNHGDRITGSAERAVAAWFNAEFGVTADAEDNWFNVEHRDTSEVAKKLAGPKKEIYTVWKSSNPSVKFSRVKTYGRELAAPAIMALIAEFTTDDARSDAYLENDLIDPNTQPEEKTEGTAPTSRTRDLYERSVVELGKLYRALNATDNDAVIKGHAKSLELQAALVDVTKALKTLGAPVDDEALVTFMKAVAKR